MKDVAVAAAQSAAEKATDCCRRQSEPSHVESTRRFESFQSLSMWLHGSGMQGSLHSQVEASGTPGAPQAGLCAAQCPAGMPVFLGVRQMPRWVCSIYSHVGA